MVLTDIVGTWLLESNTIRFSDGSVEPGLGGESRGAIMYDLSGRMSAQIFKIERTAFAKPDPRRGTPDEMSEAYENSVSYFGSYETIGESMVVHHVEGSLFPNWEGTDLIRHFRIEGKRLHITTPEIEASGRKFVGELVWKRVD